MGTALRSKTFNCPVHGHFDLPGECVAVIDTPEFQRLRELKQLGLTYYVYPGASHARFEHSLGVAYLAGSWAQHLLRNYRPEAVLTREDRHGIRALELGALCHDLGHGPFSHVFENELLPRVLGETAASSWHHEDMSERILDHLVDANHLDLGPALGSRKDLALVKDLMRGSLAGDDGGGDGSPGSSGGIGIFGSQGARVGGHHHGAPLLPSDPEKRWLFDILANKTNGIDCDKFDYLARDSRATGVAISLDFRRIMHYSRIAPSTGQVVFKWSEYENLYRGLFQERATMHSKVYTHRKAKGIEFLVVDALFEARDLLGLAGAAWDVEAFLGLDDRVLALVDAMKPDQTDNPAAVRKAQALLQRLRRRELYVFCDECNVPAQQQSHFKKPTAEDIVSHHTSDGLTRLRPEDVIVSETRINFTAASANPLNKVMFYSPHGDQDDEPFGLQQDQVSSLFGHNHQDHKLRIFCRNRDPRTCEALRAAFRRWSERQAGWGKQQHSTPFKFKAAPGAGGGGSGGASGGGGEARANKRARSLTFGDGNGNGAAQQRQQQPAAAADARLCQTPIPE
ncbi:MAG: hypothetical protein J3K34DRAFT_220944 [Monoraphidium minutum]|nr:MAG: hypothetical protein J3K34DRAFT_220944 [Monoraphidium minutum]